MEEEIDHTFFDDGNEMKKPKSTQDKISLKTGLGQSFGTRPQSSSSIGSQSDLHGSVNDKFLDVNNSDHENENTNMNKEEKYYQRSHGSSESSVSSVEEVLSIKNDIEMPLPTKYDSDLDDAKTDTDTESDDTFTDVSPSLSPEQSPKISRKNPLISEIRHNSFETENTPKDVKHITKLNVTFKHNKPDKSRKSTTEAVEQQLPYNITRSKDRLKQRRNRDEFEALSKSSLQPHFQFNQEVTAIHRQRINDSSCKDPLDLNHLLEMILDFEDDVAMSSKCRKFRDSSAKPVKQRKNLSFSNDKIRDIDRENQRLLRQITGARSLTSSGVSSRGSRPSSAASVSSCKSQSSVQSRNSSRGSTSGRTSAGDRRNQPTKLYHSAVNRLHFQKQIEKENMQLLKRLQSAKPTPHMQREHQIADYKRQVRYMGSAPPRREPRRAFDLSKNADVIKEAIGVSEGRFRQIRPAWQDVW